MLQMAEAGLLDEWRRRFQQDDGHCDADSVKSKDKKKRNRQPKTTRITIKNLSGAFVVLLVGYFGAIFVFIGELIFFRLCPGHPSIVTVSPTTNCAYVIPDKKERDKSVSVTFENC